MDSKIAILPEDVVNQIAAGEVVERPASAVKELCENSLDAGARRIEVEAEGGGVERLRVLDDGCGMSEAELLLCLERHATSKLRRVDDLLALRTMGFRGEALPSIAAVSRLELSSRPAESDAGHRVALEAGRLLDQQPVGCPRGTQITAADLFFNTPARLKFLKSSATEAAHISEAVSRLALASPRVHFALSIDGRRVLDFPPCESRLERARAVLGRRGASLFAGSLAQDDLVIEAALAPADQSGRTAQSVTLLINGRFVRDRSLVHAVTSGYGTLLAGGRYPTAVVHLELHPSSLDVNVHPQKTEVRLAEPGRVFSSLRRCVEETLARGGSAREPSAPARSYVIRPGPRASSGSGYEEHRLRLLEATRRFWSAQSDRAPFVAAEAAEAVPAYASAEPTRRSPVAMAAVAPAPRGPFGRLRPIGQALGTYWVCATDDELVLLDQHAAHERITFERLRAAWQGGGVPAQRLLIPATLELEPRLEAAARESGALLHRLGFELEPFGGSTWTVRSVPEVLRHGDPASLARAVIEELAESGASELVGVAQQELLARMACHASVRAGQVLSLAEVGALLASLDQIDFSQSCPHGRPVVVRFTRTELERRFGRQ